MTWRRRVTAATRPARRRLPRWPPTWNRGRSISSSRCSTSAGWRRCAATPRGFPARWRRRWRRRARGRWRRRRGFRPTCSPRGGSSATRSGTRLRETRSCCARPRFWCDPDPKNQTPTPISSLSRVRSPATCFCRVSFLGPRRPNRGARFCARLHRTTVALGPIAVPRANRPSPGRHETGRTPTTTPASQSHRLCRVVRSPAPVRAVRAKHAD